MYHFKLLNNNYITCRCSFYFSESNRVNFFTDMECEEPEPVCENKPPTQDKTPLTERAPPQDRIPPVDKAPPQDRIPSVDSTPRASRDRDVTSLSEEDQVQFLTLVSGAKEEMRQGRAAEALRSYKQAAQIYPSDKLHSKIQKLEVKSTNRKQIRQGQMYIPTCICANVS